MLMYKYKSMNAVKMVENNGIIIIQMVGYGLLFILFILLENMISIQFLF